MEINFEKLFVGFSFKAANLSLIKSSIYPPNENRSFIYPFIPNIAKMALKLQSLTIITFS